MNEILTQLKTFFTDSLASACQSIAIAILILVIGFWIARLVSRAIRKSKLFGRIEPASRGYLAGAIDILLKGIVLISAAAYVGVPMASVAAVLGSCGLALGLALQGGLSNIAGGIMLLITRPFQIGDYVVIDTVEGTVDAIGIYYTELITPDNQKVVLPNGTVTNSVIIDYTAKETRRISMDFPVSDKANLDRVRNILNAELAKCATLLPEPAFQVLTTNHTDTSVTFTIRAWAKNEDYWNCVFALRENIKRALEEEGVESARQKIDVTIKN